MDATAFITKWLGARGGRERSNFGPFIYGLCDMLGVEGPNDAAVKGQLGAYEFEGPVPGGSFRSLKASGSIDLYKRGNFIMEAKQSYLPTGKDAHPDLFEPAPTAPQSPSGATYDRLMRDALAQAKNYAQNLPADQPWPPFLIVCDIGRAFELYFDWSGNGRGYSYFPDQHSYRFTLDRFADAEVHALFRAIWTDPASIDPRAKSAEVSRGIAKRLADVSKWRARSGRGQAEQATASAA